MPRDLDNAKVYVQDEAVQSAARCYCRLVKMTILVKQSWLFTKKGRYINICTNIVHMHYNMDTKEKKQDSDVWFF